MPCSSARSQPDAARIERGRLFRGAVRALLQRLPARDGHDAEQPFHMMRKLLLLLTLQVTSCQKAAEVGPSTERAADEVEVTTQGRNPDCGVAQVVASDPAQVRRVIGPSGYEPTYVAYQLDTALWVRKNRALYVRIRRPQPQEAVVCTALGPGYAAFTVISARVKAGSE